MKPRPLGFHEAVSRDLRAAQEFYAAWRPNGAAVITTRIETRLASVARTPELFPKVYRDIRRALVPRSYFGLFYRLHSDRVEVLALLDLRRDPVEIESLVSARRDRRKPANPRSGAARRAPRPRPGGNLP